MKTILLSIVSVALLGLGGARANLTASDSLQENFQSPPNSAKPHTWWHWMNGYVSAEGITKDLEAMQRTGIGGFQAFQIERLMDKGPIKYLSKEWRELMTHTIQEADRLGLEVRYHQTAGWSSSGGPWITNEWTVDRQHAEWIREFYKDCEKAGVETLPDAANLGIHFNLRFGDGWKAVIEENFDKYKAIARLQQTASMRPISLSDDGALAFNVALPAHTVKPIELKMKD